MKCPECGTENFTYVRFCTKCGYDFFAPAIEDIGSDSIIQTDPLPVKERASRPGKRAGANDYPFQRVMMITITTFLVAGGIGLIGGLVGFITRRRDRLKGAMLGALINAGIVVVILIVVLTLGPLARSIRLPDLESLTNLIRLPNLSNLPNLIDLSSLNSEPSSTPSVQKTGVPSPSASSTIQPTSSCLPWDQITLQQEGVSLCVNGTVATVYPITGNMGNTLTRINFSTTRNSFFLLSRDDFLTIHGGGSQPGIQTGDCVQALGIIKIFSSGTQSAPFMQVKQLYPCGN